MPLNLAMMTPLERQFHWEMLNGCETLKQHGYDSTSFCLMVQEYGAVAAVHQILKTPDYEDRLTALWEIGRLASSVEAIVMNPRWSSFFNIAEITEARNRLRTMKRLRAKNDVLRSDMPIHSTSSNAADDMLATSTQSIIADTRVDNWKALPLERAIALSIAHPDQIADFVQAVVSELPQSHTLLLLVLPFLPEEDFPRVVAHNIASLAQNLDNESACMLVDLVALQCSSALHPYLETLFDLRSDQRGYDRYDWESLWHEASAKDVLPFLRSVIESDSRDAYDRFDAWLALMKTRDQELIRYALSVADHIPMRYAHLGPKDYVRYADHEVIDRNDDRDHNPALRRLYSEPDAVYHLVFADGYVRQHDFPTLRPWSQTHPTWHLDPLSDAAPLRFGGLLREIIDGDSVLTIATESWCEACDNELSHLLTLTSIPDGLGVTGMESLTLAACLSCIASGAEARYFAHSSVDGIPLSILYDGPTIEPQEPAAVLVPTEIRLARTPPRWCWQNWGQSNGRENLSRVGGAPCWVQDMHYLSCPHCRRTMTALLQLALELPVERVDATDLLDNNVQEWSCDGLAYVQWCNACKISAVFCQTT